MEGAFRLRRSRGTAASESALVDGDGVGSFAFYRYDGSAYRKNAAIEGEVENGDSSLGIKLLFQTSEGTTAAQNRLIITPVGNVGINSDAPTAKLDVNGTLNVSGISTFNNDVRITDKFETIGTGVSISNGGTTTATIAGPETLIIDPAAVGDNTGTVRIKGDFIVDGTTTTVNSTTVDIADKVIGIATTCNTDLLTDGAGIGIGSDKTFLYEFNSGTNPSLKSSENLNVSAGKGYQINQVEVLNATTLGSSVVNSSLTSVGTLNGLNVTGFATATNFSGDGSQLTGITASQVGGALTSFSIESQTGSTTYYIGAQDAVSGVSSEVYVNSNIVIRDDKVGIGLQYQHKL